MTQDWTQSDLKEIDLETKLEETLNYRNDEEILIRLLLNPGITADHIDMIIRSRGLCFFHRLYDFAYKAIKHPSIHDETLRFIVGHDSDNDSDTINMQKAARDILRQRLGK